MSQQPIGVVFTRKETWHSIMTTCDGVAVTSNLAAAQRLLSNARYLLKAPQQCHVSSQGLGLFSAWPQALTWLTDNTHVSCLNQWLV